ncbi:MAG: M48 family metalloprotease [Vicinamibacterales bacterium]
MKGWLVGLATVVLCVATTAAGVLGASRAARGLAPVERAMVGIGALLLPATLVFVGRRTRSLGARLLAVASCVAGTSFAFAFALAALPRAESAIGRLAAIGAAAGAAALTVLASAAALSGDRLREWRRAASVIAWNATPVGSGAVVLMACIVAATRASTATTWWLLAGWLASTLSDRLSTELLLVSVSAAQGEPSRRVARASVRVRSRTGVDGFDVCHVGGALGAELPICEVRPRLWRHPVVFVSSRATDALSDDELEAVLAHEVAHVAHGDLSARGWLTEACLALGGVAVWTLVDAQTRWRLPSDVSRVVGLGVSLVIVRLGLGGWISRRRERRADAFARRHAPPEALMGALRALVPQGSHIARMDVSPWTTHGTTSNRMKWRGQRGGHSVSNLDA